MKKIGLLSDTHSHWDERYVTHLSLCDEIWHAGDIGSLEVLDKLNSMAPVRAVYGNIDDARMRVAVPESLLFIVEGVKVFITHIGGYPGKYSPLAKRELLKNKPKLFICGHSHILKVMYDKFIDCLHINPGAAGIYGFHQVRTLIRLDIHEGDITNLEVIELGKR